VYTECWNLQFKCCKNMKKICYSNHGLWSRFWNMSILVPYLWSPVVFKTLYTFLLFGMTITTCHMVSHEWSSELRSSKQCVAKLNTVKQVKQAGLQSRPQLPKWPSGHQMASLHFFWWKKRFSSWMAVQYFTVIFTASIYYGTIC